jgi:hypothetical protein
MCKRTCMSNRHCSLYSSSSLALQLVISFGLLNYFFPFFPLLRRLFPVLHSHLLRSFLASSSHLFAKFVMRLLASFLVEALLEHSICLNIYFLSYSLVLALVVYCLSVRLSIIEHFKRYWFFFWGVVGGLAPNPQPGRPGCLSSSDFYPLTCPAWMALPVATLPPA